MNLVQRETEKRYPMESGLEKGMSRTLYMEARDKYREALTRVREETIKEAEEAVEKVSPATDCFCGDDGSCGDCSRDTTTSDIILAIRNLKV